MKCLVTGAAGFVGSTLAKSLLDDGHSVIGIDSFTDYYDPALKRHNIAPLLGRMELIEGDLNSVDLRSIIGRDVNVVFHQAGQPGVRKSWGKDFGTYLDENIAATQKLLESSIGSASLKRVVYASSSSVYGNAAKYPTSESDLPQPMSPYGVSKLAAEHLCSLYAQNYGLETVSLRYFTVYGPGQRPDMAFTRFITAALKGENLEVYGAGDQIRDFTFVDDIVAANKLAAFTDGVPPGKVMNAAGGTSVTINEVIELLGTIIGRPIGVERSATVRGDVFRTGGDASELQSLGWKPQVAIEEGLRRQVEWVRARLDSAADEVVA